jgi:bifunctional DNA-binding transcriptional regulator/antitoxin component of YhaV-PrlF toxin-antitoxin module
MAKIKETQTTYSTEPITVVTTRGTTEIPRVLRERYRITARSRLRWVDTGEGWLIVPLEQPVVSRVSKLHRSLSAKSGKLQVIRPENLEAMTILRDWMQEPNDWTPEQWDEFEQELRTRRFSLRKPA